MAYVKCFTHNVSLDAYPNAKYWIKKAEAGHKKFSSLISSGPMPDMYSDEEELTALNELSQIPDVITLKVFGKTDLKDADLMLTTDFKQDSKDQSSKMTSPGLTAYICNFAFPKLGTETHQEISTVLKLLRSMVGKNENVIDSLIIVIESKEKTSQETFEAFVSAVQTTTDEHFGRKLPRSHIVMEIGDLGKCITNWVKTIVSHNLERRQAYLKNFVRVDRDIRFEKIDITQSEEFITAVKGFLRNGYAFIDILADSGKTLFIDLLLNSLKSVLKCSVVSVTSQKYGFRPQDINRLAHAYSLEKKLEEAVSKNTRYYLSQMEKDCRAIVAADKAGDSKYRFPLDKYVNISSSIANDLEKVVLGFEESLLPLKATSFKMRKLLFQNDALQHSLLPGMYSKNDTRVPYELFKQLTELEYVFGVGTFYGEVEIHITECDIRKAECEIHEVLDQMPYKVPVRIRKIQGMPKCLFHQGAALRPGNIALNETLGCFFSSENGMDLYGITCAHMFQGGLQQQVSIDANGVLSPFATSDPNLRILTGEVQNPIIDIAALKVMDSVRDRCNRLLRDDDGNEYSGRYSANVVEVGSRVYKYGAGSYFTAGFVQCNDYLMRGARDDNDRLVLIEPEEMGNGPYAEQGDSGAMNCMTLFNGHECVVEVVSVVSSGGFRLEGDSNEICLSFPIGVGIQAISNRLNVNLVLA